MTDEYIRKADAAGVIEKEMKNYVSDIWYKSATHSTLNDANENIKSLEPADVVPVVHSRWEYKCGEIRCPECGNRIHRIDLSGYLNFCPNCGAKMDGGDEHG